MNIQDFFSDMPWDLSNHTTLPTYNFFGLFRSKHLNVGQISITNRSTGSLGFVQAMQNFIFAFLFYLSNVMKFSSLVQKSLINCCLFLSIIPERKMKLRKKPALNSHDTGTGDYITQVFNQILNRLKNSISPKN